jgi:hypothetical protein
VTEITDVLALQVPLSLLFLPYQSPSHLSFFNNSSLFCLASIMTAHAKPQTVITKLNGPLLKERRHSKSQSAFNYDNTSSNLAATTMRNELKKLVDSAPPELKEVLD